MDELIDYRPKDKLLPPGPQGLADNNPRHIVLPCIIDRGMGDAEPEDGRSCGPKFLGKLERPGHLLLCFFRETVV